MIYIAPGKWTQRSVSIHGATMSRQAPAEGRKTAGFGVCLTIASYIRGYGLTRPFRT